MKKVLSVIMMLAIFLAFVACGTPKTLSGTWVYISAQSEKVFPNYTTITFYSNNTCSITALLGTADAEYILDGDQIKISSEGSVALEGKLTYSSKKIVIEGLNKTTTLTKLDTMDKTPTKEITEEDFHKYKDNSYTKVTIKSIGEVEHKDNKYYCTVEYSSSMLGSQSEETFIWVPALDSWCQQQTSLMDLFS